MAGPRKEGQPERFTIPTRPPEIIETKDIEQLTERIKNVHLLNNSINGLQPYLSSQITLEEVKVADLVPCALYVLDQNLAIQRALRHHLLLQGVDTLHLTPDKSYIHYEWGGVEKIMTPPIIEISEDDGSIPVITDGLHRVSIAREMGESTITALVIKNTALPLSVLPVSWEQVKQVDSVPPTKEKRKMRFEPSNEMFRWFGLNDRNMQRLIGGFSDMDDYAYKAFFRDLSFSSEKTKQDTNRTGGIIRERGYDNHGNIIEFKRSKEQCLREYTSAGFIVTSKDSKQVLLGTHHEAPNLWGNFAGGRELWEIDPKVTAARELGQELGCIVDPSMDFGEPLIVIANYTVSLREKPRIGIIWQLGVDQDMEIKLPADSEIKEVGWWSGSMPLMDESNPTERLWGGVYTAEALRAFDKLRNTGVFGGIVQIDSWYSGHTQYDMLKSKEKTV